MIHIKENKLVCCEKNPKKFNEIIIYHFKHEKVIYRFVLTDSFWFEDKCFDYFFINVK